jgi:hypothetical protein
MEPSPFETEDESVEAPLSGGEPESVEPPLPKVPASAAPGVELLAPHPDASAAAANRAPTRPWRELVARWERKLSAPFVATLER